MFEHYILGMQAPIRRGSRELSPREAADAITGQQCEHSQQCPSPPLSATAVSTSKGTGQQDSRAAPDNIVDSLAQELSKQNLQLDRANLAQLQLQLSSTPLLSPQIPPSRLSPIPPTCSDIEIDNDEPHLRPDNGRRRRHDLPALWSPSPIEVDQRLAVPEVDPKRLSRQRSSHFNNNPNNTRTIQHLVRDMIASNSQCNVHRVSTPATPTSSKQRLGSIPEPEYENGMNIEVGSGGLNLQVDPAYLNGQSSDTDKEETFLIEAMMSLRRAGAPAGVRKMGGLLHYRASADAALSCANVVKSRPRMRKRNRGDAHRGGSKASSIVTPTFSSPMIPPSLPDEMLVPAGRQL